MTCQLNVVGGNIRGLGVHLHILDKMGHRVLADPEILTRLVELVAAKGN